VVVLGSKIATDLFGTAYPIDQAVKIGGTDYKVAAVLHEKGGQANNNPDSQVLMPITTMRAHIVSPRTTKGETAVNFILAQATSEKDIDTAMHEITQTLRKQHQVVYAGQDDFKLISQTQLLSTFGNITGTITLFLGAIAGISLLVGGIGIMNIMLVSVTERTREIGLRLAIGALEREVLLQFLIEAVALAALGGLIGIVIATGASIVLAGVMGVPYLFNPTINLLSFVFSAGIGVVFGFFPARRAARMDPIEALRHE
jgi:putative ABC transport system permease protein